MESKVTITEKIIMNIFGFILSTSSEDDNQRFPIFKQFDPVVLMKIYM
jgi:hypothetical protein